VLDGLTLTGEFGHQLSLMGAADWLTVSGREGAVRYRRAKWSYRPVPVFRVTEKQTFTNIAIAVDRLSWTPKLRRKGPTTNAQLDLTLQRESPRLVFAHLRAFGQKARKVIG
jgi:hypothetical protein